MSVTFKSARIGFLIATAAPLVPASGYAQSNAQEDEAETVPTPLPPTATSRNDIIVSGQREESTDQPVVAATSLKGPEIKGIITARSGDKVQVVADDGTTTDIAINEGTQIRASNGLFGLNRARLVETSLINGLPVTIKTSQSDKGLLASRITMRSSDLKIANMIRNGTAQGFAEQTAATQALRGRVSDIDEYNIKATTNINFDTGKAILSEQGKAGLCEVVSEAEAVKNALILVVGYTDSTGSDEFNQRLSEKRASRVVNHIQQACGWKPYRMLTPTGMATADPLAPNDTPDGKAQNRRVAVNILVSKGLDGL